MFGVILLTGIASAGLFDFLKSDKEIKTPSWETMNITNDFDIKKNEMKILPICLKTPSHAQCVEKNPNYEEIDISDSDYFYKNSGNIVRFTN